MAVGEVDDLALGAGHQQPDRAAPDLSREGGRDRARGLSHAVALAHHAAEPVGGRLLELGSERGGGAQDGAQAGQVEPLHGRLPDELLDDRRRQERARDATILEQTKEAVELVAGHRHDGRAGEQAEVQVAVQPDHVKERR